MNRATYFKVFCIAALAGVITLIYSSSFSDVQQAPSDIANASADFIQPASEDIRTARKLIQSNDFEQAEFLLKKLVDDKSELVRGQAQCSLAEVAIRTSDFTEAEEKIHACDAMVKPSPNFGELRAFLQHLKGFKSHSVGAYDQAIQEYETSLQMSVVASGPKSSPFLNTLNNLGNVYYRLGRYRASESIHLEVLDGRVELLGEGHSKVAASLGNLGNVYEGLGMPSAALDQHSRALSIWTKTLGHESLQAAYTLDNIGQSMLRLDKFEDAKEHLEQALEIKTRELGPRNPQLANTLIHSSEALLGLHDVGASIIAAESAIRVLEEANLKALPLYSLAVNVLAHALLSSGETDSALTLTRSELDRIQTAKLPAEVALRNTHSKICARVKEFRCALESAQVAIDLNTGIEGAGLRESYTLLHSASSRDRLVSSLFLKAQALIELAKQSDSDALRLRAFDTFDVAMSYAQSSFVVDDSGLASFEPNMDVSAHMDQFVRAGLSLYQDSGDQYLATRMFAILDVQNGGPLLASMRSKGLGLNQHQEETAWRHSPSRLFGQYDTLSPSEMVPGSSIISYFEVDSSLVAVVVNASGYSFHALGALNPLAQMAQRYRQLISNRHEDDQLELAFQLFSRLIEPLDEVISDDALVIIPSKSVKGIPFETLLTEEVGESDLSRPFKSIPYLLSRNAISYSYSASLLELQLENRSGPFERELLALAPVFDQSQEYSHELKAFLKSVSVQQPIERLVSLPGTAREVVQIGDILEDSRRDGTDSNHSESNAILLRQQASEFELKSMNLSGARILHIATHSFINPNDPDSSGIILETEGRRGEDGILFAREILDLQIEAELVVLSSCDTASQTDNSNFELSGFAKGFVYAGARHLVASIWPADDVGTQILMQRFYTHIASGQSPNQALASAKMDLIEMGGPIADPYFWAGFIHIGSPEGMMREAA